MSSLRTPVHLLIFAVACLAAPSSALTQTAPPSDPLRTFATCAGRLSAQMEFEWMFDGPASDVTKARRGEVLDILEAMTPPTQARAVLNWRVEAKMAHASLLKRTAFSDDARVKMQARRLAATKLDRCTALLLG